MNFWEREELFEFCWFGFSENANHYLTHKWNNCYNKSKFLVNQFMVILLPCRLDKAKQQYEWSPRFYHRWLKKALGCLGHVSVLKPTFSICLAFFLLRWALIIMKDVKRSSTYSWKMKEKHRKFPSCIDKQ